MYSAAFNLLPKPATKGHAEPFFLGVMNGAKAVVRLGPSRQARPDTLLVSLPSAVQTDQSSASTEKHTAALPEAIPVSYASLPKPLFAVRGRSGSSVETSELLVQTGLMPRRRSVNAVVLRPSASARAFSTTALNDHAQVGKGEIVIQVRKVPISSHLPTHIDKLVFEKLVRQIESDSKKDKVEAIFKFKEAPSTSDLVDDRDPFEIGRDITDSAYRERYNVTSSLKPTTEVLASVKYPSIRLPMHALYLGFQNLEDKFWSHLPGLLTKVFSEFSRDEVNILRPQGDNLEFGRLAVVPSLRGTGVVKYLIGDSLRGAMYFENKSQLVCVCADNVRRKLVEEGFKVTPLTGEISHLMDKYPEKTQVMRSRLVSDLGFEPSYLGNFENMYLRTQRPSVIVITDPYLNEKLHTSGIEPRPPLIQSEFDHRPPLILTGLDAAMPDVTEHRTSLPADLNQVVHHEVESKSRLYGQQDLEVYRELHKRLCQILEAHDSKPLFINTPYSDIVPTQTEEAERDESTA